MLNGCGHPDGTGDGPTAAKMLNEMKSEPTKWTKLVYGDNPGKIAKPAGESNNTRTLSCIFHVIRNIVWIFNPANSGMRRNPIVET